MVQGYENQRTMGVKGSTMMDLTTDTVGLSLTSSAFHNGGNDTPEVHKRWRESVSPSANLGTRSTDETKELCVDCG
jgi:hypothetical protein